MRWAVEEEQERRRREEGEEHDELAEPPPQHWSQRWCNGFAVRVVVFLCADMMSSGEITWLWMPHSTVGS